MVVIIFQSLYQIKILQVRNEQMEVELQNTCFPRGDVKDSNQPAHSNAIDNLDNSLKPPNPQETFIKAMLEVISY